MLVGDVHNLLKKASTSSVFGNGMTQAQLAEKIKTTSPYVNRIIKKQDGVVNKTFVQMLEAPGYDIELTYVRRED